MTEVKVHDKYLVVIPRDVRETLGIKIGETVDFIVEQEKAVIYPKRGDPASVEKLHGIIKHKGAIDEGIEKGYAVMGDESR